MVSRTVTARSGAPSLVSTARNFSPPGSPMLSCNDRKTLWAMGHSGMTSPGAMP